MSNRWLLSFLLAPLLFAWSSPPGSAGAGASTSPAQVLQAGAAAVDISPTHFPIEVNGGFTARFAESNKDRLHSRALVLDNGSVRLALVIVDSLMLTRELLDESKRLIEARTGIAQDRLLIGATHTHSAPSAMGCLGTEPDPVYAKFLQRQIALSVEQALANLGPARIGWTVADASGWTHCRRWILRPDRLQPDPFGRLTVRAMMHPGHQNPDYLGPSSLPDTGLSLLSLQSTEGRPLALLANLSMHYFGGEAVSSDYFGRFAQLLEERLGAGSSPPFVAMMSQGTSGDLQWRDYAQPEIQTDMDRYAQGVAEIAARSYAAIQYRDWVPLTMAESTLRLQRRTPDKERLAWALEIVDRMGDRRPQAGQRPRGSGGRGLEEIYAREALFLLQDPVRELKLQAIRIGDLGITALPNEVYSLTGLKLKRMSPLEPTFNIELANGAEGYIPPPEQHVLGGYTTWPARTAGLEVQAEPRIVESLLQLLEKVAGRPRRAVQDPVTAYTRAVQASKPLAYWPLGEMQGRAAADRIGQHTALFRGGFALYLEGAPLGKGNESSKAPQLAGGSVEAELPALGSTYSLEMWFRNDLPVDARALTGVLWSRADQGGGDYLVLAGAGADSGLLTFFSGADPGQNLKGKTRIREKSWNHLVLARGGARVTLFLNGKLELEGTSPPLPRAGKVLIGGSERHPESFEGRIDEVAIYGRSLSVVEAAAHYQTADF